VSALRTYQDYLNLEHRNESLTEESETSIIELAFDLYKSGKKPYLEEIERRLMSSNKVIKYYAAHMLSFVKEKKIATKAIPTLKEMAEIADDELRDRAKIALLRIDPNALKHIEEEKYERRARILKIRAYQKGKKKPSFSLNIPWALADLAFGAIPDKDKALIRKKGYDIDKILRDLARVNGNIIEIEGKDTVIKIWIDY
jgi:hypothetical protein